MLAVCSQSLMDIMMCLLLLVWLYGVWQSHKLSGLGFRKIGIEWAFAGYLVTIVLGFIFNSVLQPEWFYVFFKFTWIFSLYFFINFYEAIDFDLVKTLKFMGTLVIIPVVGALVIFIQTNSQGLPEEFRLLGFVNSATYYAHGNAMLLVFLLNLFLFLYKKISRSWNIMILVSLTLMVISIYFTYTRGIWISLFLSTVLMGLVTRNIKKVVAIFSLTFAAVLILFLTSQQFKDRLHHSLSAKANHERVDLFNVNVQMWKEYPLLGIGYGENIRRNREYWDRPEWNRPAEYITSHAHNQYLNVLSTTGILGFIFFMSFISFFLRKNYLMFKAESAKNTVSTRYILLHGCLWMQFEFLLACLTDVSFEYAKIRILLVLTWALVMALDKPPKPQLTIGAA